jgi:hypothetical protein
MTNSISIAAMATDLLIYDRSPELIVQDENL